MWEATIRPNNKIGSPQRATLGLWVIFTLCSAGLVSHSQGVPSNLQAAIFFKVLSYDYNLSSKAGNSLTIGVITDKKTAGQKSSLLSGFNKLNSQTIQGKAIQVVEISISDPSQLAGKVGSAKADILYLADGADEKTIRAVLAIASKDKRATLGGSETLAERGFAIGLTVEGGKPKIVVNLPAAQKQGMKLSSKVLRLARVIK